MKPTEKDIYIKRIKQLLKSGRKAYQKASTIESEIFDILDQLGIPDPSLIPTNAENANSLFEAITCFTQYGEYSVAQIAEEIESISGTGSAFRTEQI